MTNEDLSELQSIWDDARHSIERGDYDKAIEIYQYILIRYSDYPINAYLGDIFLTLRQFNLAENHIKKTISFKPEKPGYHYILGFISSVKRQWDKAILEFEIAVDKELDNGEYLRRLAWAIYSSGDIAKGLASLEETSRMAPTNVNIPTDPAVAYLSSVNINKATEYAERAVPLDPTSAPAQDVLKSVSSFAEEFRQRRKGADKVRTTTTTYFGTHIIHQFKVSLRDRTNIWRIIEIKENQMLSSLHKAIFKAFDRFEKHSYSFFINNKPYDKESEYTSPGLDTQGTSRLATHIRIDSLALHPG